MPRMYKIYVHDDVHMYACTYTFNMPEIISGENTDYVIEYTSFNAVVIRLQHNSEECGIYWILCINSKLRRNTQHTVYPETLATTKFGDLCKIRL